MADQTALNKPLDPNASPYNKIPANFFLHVFSPPWTYDGILTPVHPSVFYTYNIRLQPYPRKPLPISLTQPPSPPPAEKISFSLTPVTSGPRIPKSRLPRRCTRMNNVFPMGNSDGGEMKWRPKFPESKGCLDVVGKLGFEGRRWKNIRREYQRSLPLETNTTSLMIKNVPNKYTRKLLMQTLDVHCETENKKSNNGGSVDDADGFVRSAYDFLYLPIDFNRRANAGFAFVNFTTPEAALRFRDAFNGKRWNCFDSQKVAEITKARIQGKAALVNNCKGMNFAYGSEEDMPVWFAPARDGSARVPSKMFMVGRCLHRQK